MQNNSRRAALSFIVPIVVAIALLIGLHIALKKGQVAIDLQVPDLKSLSAKLDNKTLTLHSVNSTVNASPGKHTLSVSKSGYNTFSTTFTVTASQTTTINVAMQLTSPPSLASTSARHIQATLTQALHGFDVQNVVYFYQNTWAFVTVNAGDGNNGILVASYDAGKDTWNIVLGPGTGFTSDDVKGLPSNVVTYMKQNNYYAEQ